RGEVLDGLDGRKEEVHAPADGDEALQVVYVAADRALRDGEVLSEARRVADGADDRVGVVVQLVEAGEVGPRMLDELELVGNVGVEAHEFEADLDLCGPSGRRRRAELVSPASPKDPVLFGQAPAAGGGVVLE